MRWLPVWILLLCGVGCDSEAVPTHQAIPASEPPLPSPEVTASEVAILPVFQDVAAEMGIHAPFYTDTIPGRYFLPEIMGGGATWIDFDVDGQLDLYLTNGTRFEPSSAAPIRGNWLYRGRVGTSFALVDESLGAGDTGYGQGSAAGDFNADGFPDLYVGNVGPNALYVNEGDGTFSLDTTSAPVADPAWTSSVLWLDLNRDGWLDLYVVNYLKMTLADRKICEYEKRSGYCGPGQYAAAPDHVYLNAGDGTFRDATDELGMTDKIGKGLAVLAADFDHDQIPEIYVANDMTANFLYTRKSSDLPAYEEVAMPGGCAQSGEGMNEASMGISCSDFDLDGFPDLYLTHYYNMQKTLYKNHGELQFEDVSRRMRTAQTGYSFLGFGTLPIDYDGNRYPDLFVTNGHVLGPAVQPDRMTPQWLYNHHGQHFEDITRRLDGYFQKTWLGRGAASADFDNDGDLDITVTHLDDPAALLRNSTKTGKRFIGFELRTRERIIPCGSRVTVTSRIGANGPTVIQSQSIMLGGSYLSSSDPRIVFPVDHQADSVDVQIQWSSGKVEEFPAMSLDRYWHLVEGAQPW